MEIIVQENNIRLDKYISDFTEYSRSLLEKMIEGNAVTVNGVTKKSSYKVKVDDIINIDESFKEEIILEKNKIDLDIIYEDDYLIVINKPSGLVVHPGSGNYNNTLVNGLLAYTDELSDEGGEARAGIVHRLDKAHEILSDGFKNKTIKREYIALICGVFPSQSAKINAPIGKSNKDFKKQEVYENGKSAVTNLWVLKRFKKHTLIRLSLETGRTHQIRVHLNYINYPIYNDPVYGNTKKATEFGQFLHSTYLNFEHPITKKVLEFEIELPKEMKKFIKDLD